MPEVPRRLEVILSRLAIEPWEVALEGASRGWRDPVLAVHHPGYVARLERAVERGDGLIDSADTPLSPGTLSAAQAAVEATLRAADWLIETQRVEQPLTEERLASAAGEGATFGPESPRRAFVAVRPPGHHAESEIAMGFCYFNNIAVAADYLVRERQVERVAIVDFDVHHGNGTQHLFDTRADVFFASVHQHPFYPGTGLASEVGHGAGKGMTLNIPLPAGSTDVDYERALHDRVFPAVRRFAPEVLLVSAGFDAWRADPLGGMRISEAAFRDWGRWLAELADELCGGRLLSTLEGGYDLDALPDLVVAYLAGQAEREAG